ncbi:DUF2218 domain-containing protein [Tropicimonas marinistellae]|uniref:DUF2218 domain-containing protein n=1 Tax=Tropicimonas marinistellae TaxID=1739787 RepID=UPI00083544FB|nr:DUF2218 domain-containing protein [Tropicimonas marinistellae]
MYELTGSFRTANASKYLQQLCKHFAHKVEVCYEPEWGCVCFPFGRVEMKADDDCLSVSCKPETAEQADRVRGVIDSHLERFAFREAFTSMDWTKTELTAE